MATETLRVTTADKKFTVIQMSDGTSHAMRHGDAWQVFPEGGSVGNLALALAHDLEAAQRHIAELQRERDQLKAIVAGYRE